MSCAASFSARRQILPEAHKNSLPPRQLEAALLDALVNYRRENSLFCLRSVDMCAFSALLKPR